MDSSRAEIFKKENEKPSFRQIQDFLKKEKDQGHVIYPEEKNIFHAFNLTRFEETKVVILGQDPYHGEGQAMGLAFSVPEGVKLPPSLRNIYKELALEYPGYDITQSGDLTRRAEQGVLLLNAILSVRASEAGSHRDIGREKFTDEIIKYISINKRGVVFLLWGAFAQSKKNLIDINHHKILKSVHPSPLSAYRGWFGNNHFLQTNEYLESQGQQAIAR